jgi:DNA gyrase subunit A
MKGENMAELKPVIAESFIQYSGAVLQSRALVDVRDCLKPSARQIFYCLFTDNFLHSKPFKKTLKGIGSAMRLYIHGDSSCEGVIMRAGQPFAMRYPLIEVEGSYGNLMESGNWAAPRYTSSRLSALSEYLFADIKKNTISEWRDNYDDTEQYPAVLTGKGFYNIVNGSFGIGIGMGASIPAFNLREVNEALIKLLWNPDVSFDEIYCAPDFATGAILLNNNEVKESLKTGNGKACKLRSVIEFDSRERALIVKQIPYGVYTNTICAELEEIINGEENPGIDRFNDLTASEPNIKIYLTRAGNADRVLKYLYKNTSLQYYYGVNLMMLDNGRHPKLFTWKEALQAHLNHEQEIYTKGFQFDLKKIEDRLHIIKGLLICMASIDEVVHTIKSSQSTASASKALQEKFLLDADQAKAVLNMKLSKLAHLEVQKLEEECDDLTKKAEEIRNILNDETLLKKEIEKGLQEVAKKFGDARRTKILNLVGEEDIIEKKQLSLSFTNKGAVFVTETSTLYAQKRNGVGAKFKLENDEFIVDNIIGENTNQILFFTSHGNYYHMKMGDFVVGEKQYLNNLVTLLPYETVKNATVISKTGQKKYIIFVTKNGIIKKSELSEYNMKRRVGAIALTLNKDDEIMSVLFTDDEEIGLLSSRAHFIMIETSPIRPIGRTARGVIGMKLNEGDSVVSARIIPKNTKEILSISEKGYSKRTDITEFKLTGRGTKGVKIQKEEVLCDFLPIVDNSDILVSSTSAQIRVKLDDFAKSGRGAQGTKTIKMTETSKVIGISKF